jgi:cell division protein ZipA
MNELRWILLIAGALLIAGIYVWGLRSRSRNAADKETRRSTVLAKPLDVAEPAAPASPGGVAPAAAGGARRIEPSVSLDDEIETTPAIERRGDFRADPDEPDAVPSHAPARGRREPTYGTRAEPKVVTSSPEPVAVRPEPTQGARTEATFETRRPAPSARTEPAVGAAAPATAPTVPTAAATPSAESAKPRRSAQKIFAVRVTTIGTAQFTGERILESLQAEGLQFGRYDIFHRLHDNGRPLFSVASLKDPGTFDLQAMPQTEYPGVLVFTVLPGPAAAGEAFDEMLFTARALATHLGGALADDKGVPLTAHRAGRLREEALEFERTVAGAA